jgi:hypothetical protein
MSAVDPPIVWKHYLVVIALVLLTRGPLWGSDVGEPDTARYAFGLRFWIEHGPGSPAIINRELSSGYYWLAAHLVQLGDVPFTRFPRLLGTISLVAALVTGPVLYRLGSLVIGPAAALAATITLLLGPAWWWAGFQAHPQGLGMALQLASMMAFLEAWRRRAVAASPAWLALSGLALVASLLVKTDAVLLVPAYVALRLLQRAQQQRLGPVEAPGRTLVVTAGLLGASYTLFAVVHGAITGPRTPVAVEATSHIARFLTVPTGPALAQQLAPVLFGPGPATLALASIAAAVFVARHPVAWRREWLMLLAAWCLPSFLVWLAIAGNNARHMILVPVPVVWLAFAWLARFGTRRMVVVTAVTLAGNLIVPANSGLSLYPSANVPASAALLRNRQDELRAVARRLLAGDAGSACYVGRTTQDYVAQYVLEDADAARYQVELLPGDQLRLALRHADGRPFRRVDVIGLRDRQDAGIDPRRWPDCAVVESLEYEETGGRRRFFGTESAPLDRLVRAVARGGR